MMPLQDVALPDSSDESLADRARRGARGAFVALVARYEDRIYRLALRMSHDESDAEEIAQETFLRALRGIRFFRGDASFATWLYRIAMNEALMRRRARMRRPTESLDALPPGSGDAAMAAMDPRERIDDMVDDKRLALRVRQALGQLDDGQRAALVLRDLEGLTAEEASEVLGISPEAVRQRAHRARLRLRELLGDLVSRPA